MRQQLSNTPKPDFIDHFPRTALGHGGRGGMVKGQAGSRICVEDRCELNARGKGEAHRVGASQNAAEWEEQVGYNGPLSGARGKEKRPERKERAENPSARCHERCRIKGRELHTVCLMSAPQTANILERLIHHIDLLTMSRQDARKLAQYAGVEGISQRKAVA